MRRLPLILAFALAGLLAVSAASAQSAPTRPGWKWRDANGRTQFSDLPPPSSVPAKDILDRPSAQRKVADTTTAEAPASTVSAPSTRTPPRVDPELEARRKRAADEQMAQQRQVEDRNAALRAANCGRARERMTALVDGLRVTRPNAQGELEVLDDQARAEEIQRTRGVIASDCR